jgi:LuxR family transcriptional regulator, maltose regulon positive regulatory protein
MSTPILATKLYIPPPRPKVVLRPRLIERLNEGLAAGRRLTLISASAGFGKTTLVSEWVADRERGEPKVRVAWLSLDEGDSDPTRFLAYLIAALQAIFAGIGAGVLGALESPQPPPTEALLTALLNEIATVPEDFVLVLDDYHIIDAVPVDASTSVDDVLTFLLEHLPPQMHLVIASREDPHLPLARLRARGQSTELRAADLRFTPAETADFLNQVMGLNLSAEDIAALGTRTEGWIAGLQLAALSMQGHQDASSFIKSFTGSHHFVLDYLLEEVLQYQPASIQAFLLGTSILDRLCGPLCEAVLLTPAGSGQATLEYLERLNLFIVRLDSERQWYRYHRLFADLLRQRLQQSESNIAVYHLRASQWCEANGTMAESFRHAVAAVDYARAAGVAERAWQNMDGTFQTAAWLGWIKQLPEEVISDRPVLCTQIGMALMDAGQPEASERRLRDAERRLEGSSEGMVVVEKALLGAVPAMIAMARAYNAQVQGNVADTVKYAELAQQLIPEEDVYRRAQAVIMLEITHWANGDLEAARRALDDWMNAMRQIGNDVFVIASAFALADIQVAQGRLREARRTYEQSLHLAAEASPEAQAITAHHHLGLALLHHEMEDAEGFTRHWQVAEELGRRTTLVDWPHRWHVAQARVKQDEGDYDAALELLDEAQRVYVKNPVPDLRPIEALRAQVVLKQGRLAQAQDWAHARGLSVADDLSYLREFEHLTLARLLIAENRIVQALALLDRLLEAAEAGRRTGSVLEILIVLALAHQERGDTPAALAALERSLTLAEPEGYVRIFVAEGEVMRLLISDCRLRIERRGAREGQKLIRYVDVVLAAFARPVILQSEIRNARNSGAGSPQSAIPEPLSPRELEVLRLIEQGLSNQEIADRLYLAHSTVKGYTHTLFDKLQVHRRTEAIARARALGML